MRILFMGTPDFAVASLGALIAAGHEIVGVVCQPDKKQGRKMILTAPPVKQYAQEKGLSVYQPQTLKDGAFAQVLGELNPELIVVVAYGKILPKYILDYPKYGCINVHGSILPKLRGSALIQWAVINGMEQTGVSIMQLDEGMDTGDVLLVETTDIGTNETAEDLFDRLMVLGANALIKAIDNIDKLTPIPQDYTKATHAPMLKKEMAQIDFAKPAIEIHNLIRGMNSWPVAYIPMKKGILKVYTSAVTEGKNNTPSGTVIACDDRLVVQTTKDAIELLQVQLQGKKQMSAQEFLRGNSMAIGQIINDTEEQR